MPTLRELEHDEAILIWDNQSEIEMFLDDMGISDASVKSSITGISYQLWEGEVSEVYLSESNAPYHLNSIYHSFDFYV